MEKGVRANRPTIEEGSVVYVDDDEFIVAQLSDVDEVIAQNVRTNLLQTLPIAKLSLTKPELTADDSRTLDSLSDRDWTIASERYEIIKPLLDMADRKASDVERTAQEHGYHRNTLYSWLRIFESTGVVSSLAPRQRSDKGVSRIDNKVEALVGKVIENEYLSKQRKSISTVIRLVQMECRRAKLPAPHANTIRNRINNLPDELKVRRRFGARAATEKYGLSRGSFPGADYPNAYLQIDHTKVDIILVDEEYRLPIGRPWITLAMDVYSRMVVGFYISFDAPSAASVGICISNSILPKDKLLEKYSIDAKWPCRGKPRTIHADNAKEFRGKVLKKACEEYGINLEWRPVARPHFGGHIERVLGTFAKEIHKLEGTTFSNIQERANYESSKKSSMTLAEFEKWLTILIVKYYHYRPHSMIEMPPLDMYRQGILGTETTKGIGLPSPVEDEMRLKLDLLPYEYRTVQEYGIRLNSIFYNADVLRVWVNALKSTRTKQKREFLVRYDPRDMSTIWFLDPEIGQYFPVPYRQVGRPSVTLWEIRAAKRRIREEGRELVDEDTIFDALEEMDEIAREAASKTKRARLELKRAEVARKKSSGYLKPKKDSGPATEELLADASEEKTQLNRKSLPSAVGEVEDIEETDDIDDIEPFPEMMETQYGR